VTDAFDRPGDDAINRYIDSKPSMEERDQLKEMFFGENATVPESVNDDFKSFVAKEQDAFWEKQQAEARATDPALIPVLAAKIEALDARLRLREQADLIQEIEEKDEDIPEDNFNSVNEMEEWWEKLTGTGYNLAPLRQADGTIELFGRYNGPFYAEPRNRVITDPTIEKTSVSLRVYDGYIAAGNSTFHYPNEMVVGGSVPTFRDFNFSVLNPDEPNYNKNPGSVAGDWFVYMEVAVYPQAANCAELWDAAEASGVERYFPILRAHRNTFPDQAYSTVDITQSDDQQFIENKHGGGTFTDPRNLWPTNTGLPVAKYALGVVTLEVNDAGDDVTIKKWRPHWHASDLYVPVWKWLHCTENDGILDMPDTSTLECTYAASLCAPVCITPWGIFTDHYHKAEDGLPFKLSDSEKTTFPWEDDCFLQGEAPSDNQ